jgi:glutathione-specific gamma-glutamylcyclotransferase
MPAGIAELRDRGEPLWIFAYGSLLWDHKFGRLAAEPALLRGYHRSFCLYSYDYRGTPARPGLTLGLDRGGSCRGIVLRLGPDELASVWQREMSGRLVYEARLLTVTTTKDVRKALAFITLRHCPDYAGRLPLDEAARIILGAVGRRGACREYFETTLCCLDELGLVDRPLRRLAKCVEAIAALHAADARF